MPVSPRNPTLTDETWSQPVLKGATGGWTAASGAAAPPVHSTGTDSETVWGAATVSTATNLTNPTQASLQGGFQLTATTSGATRVDN
jgi:hypothetical protein